jgi:hypothetical protein
MRDNYLSSSFSRAILTGLFLGISATLVCFGYSITYRSITDFYLSSFVNVTWIIFGCNLMLLTAGLVYSGFRKAFRHGDFFFLSLFILLALFGLWRTSTIQRSDIEIVSAHFRGLLSGIIIINTIGIILIPILYNSKKFQHLIIE